MQHHSLTVLAVVEGPHDIAFLKQISLILNRGDPRLPNLAQLEQSQRLIFIPSGGVSLENWAHRLAPLGLPEFHLLDREDTDASAVRKKVVQAVNDRPRCVGAITSKRSLENYIHPEAIAEARGVHVAFGDENDVGHLVARELHVRQTDAPSWDQLSRRAQRRIKNRVKRWLNSEAVARMTPERVCEQDPQGDIEFWLLQIAELLG